MEIRLQNHYKHAISIIQKHNLSLLHTIVRKNKY